MVKKPVPKLPYDVPWVLQRVRAFLLGREHNSALRWAKDLAPKSQPLPNLPPGASSKIRFNYYCDRDPRGEVTRPTVLHDAEVRPRTAGCGLLEEESVTDKKAELEGGGTEGAREREEKDTSDNVEGTGEKETVRVAEEKEGKGTGDKKQDKEPVVKRLDQSDKEIGKDVGNKGEKESSKMATEEEKMSDKPGDAVGKDTKKAAGEKDTIKTTEGKAETDKSNMAGEKEGKETRKKDEVVETDKIEVEGEEKGKHEKEMEEGGQISKKGEDIDSSNAVNRVPGKVWHWDMLEDGEPGKECCRVKRDGY